MLNSVNNSTYIPTDYNTGIDPQEDVKKKETDQIPDSPGTKNVPATTGPKLSAPTVADSKEILNEFVGAATLSFGASAAIVISQLMDQQRRDNTQARMLNVQATANEMRSEAKEMRDQAEKAYRQAMISAAIQMFGSILSIGFNIKGLTKVSSNVDLAKMLGGLGDGLNNLFKSGAGFMDAQKAKDQAFSDAKIKEIDARIEELRGLTSALDSQQDAIKQVLQKAIAFMESVARESNETRKRILV